LKGKEGIQKQKHVEKKIKEKELAFDKNQQKNKKLETKS
jgi:hypothetical protein